MYRAPKYSRLQRLMLYIQAENKITVADKGEATVALPGSEALA